VTVRAEIDNQDIVNVLRETRRRFPADAVAHAATLGLLALIAGAAGFGAYSSFLELAAGGFSPERFIRSAAAPTPASYIFFASFVLAGLCIFGAFAAIGARRKAKRIALEEAQIAGIATGRFDYAFTAAHLVIQGPVGVRKVAWSAYDRIEETKSNIVFWKTGGDFDFLPKNVLKDKDFLTTLEKNFGAAIKRDLACEETAHGKPLTLTYELSAQDNAEYLAAYERKRFGKWRFLRRIPSWRPLAPFAFLIFACAALAAFAAALRNADVMLAAAGIACGLIAAGVFIANGGYFRGPAHPFRKKGAWPYGQTELVTVTLSQSGVYIRRQGSIENIQWHGVGHFLERRLTAYLVIAPKKVIALPKRAFLSQDHFRTFAAYAKKRIKDAHELRAEEKQQRLMRSLKVKPAAAPSSNPPAKAAPQPQAPTAKQQAQARPRTAIA
jgi:hypothetical protein